MQPPTSQARAHHQEAEEAAGVAEDEVLSPHLSRLAETSPHADTTETAAHPPTSISHHCDDGLASSSAQQPTAASIQQHAPPGGEGPLTEEHPDREGPSCQLPGARWASAPIAPLEAGLSRSAAPQPADLPVPRSRCGHPSSTEALHPADLPVPRTRRDRAGSMLRRSTAAAGQSHAHDGRASPVARSLLGRNLPSGHGHVRHRAVLASPGRAESGSPSSRALAEVPGPSMQGQQANDSRDAQLQQRMHPDDELAGVVDSIVGPIMQESSDDEGNGEVVDERGMFQQCYKGHCNLSQNTEVIIGSPHLCYMVFA